VTLSKIGLALVDFVVVVVVIRVSSITSTSDSGSDSFVLELSSMTIRIGTFLGTGSILILAVVMCLGFSGLLSTLLGLGFSGLLSTFLRFTSKSEELLFVTTRDVVRRSNFVSELCLVSGFLGVASSVVGAILISATVIFFVSFFWFVVVSVFEIVCLRLMLESAVVRVTVVVFLSAGLRVGDLFRGLSAIGVRLVGEDGVDDVWKINNIG
jgi:hypothetical protein